MSTDNHRAIPHRIDKYWKLDPPDAMSLWIALDDVDETNGCMRVVPVSHKAGDVPWHQRADQYTAQLKTDADESLAVPLPAGSGLVHHCRTLHNTKPNHTPHHRRAWVMHVMPSGTRQFGKVLEDRLVLRGYSAIHSASSCRKV